MSRKTLLVCSSVALLGSLLVVAPAQAAPPRLEIQAGAVHPTNDAAPYEYTNFYPSTLKVQRGQTIRWTVFGFHTITFSKAGRPNFFRPDEVPGTYATTERWAFGSDCGRNGMKPCVLTPKTTYLSSGTPPFGNSPFDVKVDARPGMYRYFCAVHPGMQGALQVVAGSAPTPSQVKAQIAREVRIDSDAADAVFRAGQKATSRIDSDGTRVWRIRLGDTIPSKHVSVLAFMPGELEVAAGDKVEYVFPKPVANEVHTVTFPTEATGSFDPAPNGLGGFGFYFSCDPDDPAGGLKGVPGLWGAAGPECPASLELAVAPWMTEAHPAPGNAVLTRATYHDSAMLMPSGAPRWFRVRPDTGVAFPSRFEAEFPAPGTFAFECNIHVDLMTGSINAS